MRRLVLRVSTVTKSFEGYGTFHGIVDRLRTVKNGNRVELGARIVYEDGDDEDIFFDELLQIVDLETLSSGVVQLNSPIHQIHTDSCSFNVDEDVTEISSVDVDESVVDLGATEISTSRPSDDENSVSEADVSDREAENEGSVVGAAATAKLPLASKLDVCYHNNCSRTASFGFQGKHPILCGKHKYDGKNYQQFETTEFCKVATVRTGPKPKGEKPLTSTERGKKWRAVQKDDMWQLRNQVSTANNTVNMSVMDLEVSQHVIQQQAKEIRKLKRRLQEAELQRDQAQEQNMFYKKLLDAGETK